MCNDAGVTRVNPKTVSEETNVFPPRILGASMGSYGVHQHRGDTCQPENGVRTSNCFIRILGASMGPYSVKQHKDCTDVSVRRRLGVYLYTAPAKQS